jgi:hypothetical protein
MSRVSPFAQFHGSDPTRNFTHAHLISDTNKWYGDRLRIPDITVTREILVR